MNLAVRKYLTANCPGKLKLGSNKKGPLEKGPVIDYNHLSVQVTFFIALQIPGRFLFHRHLHKLSGWISHYGFPLYKMSVRQLCRFDLHK
jgi:hypothetical protein